MHVKFRLIKDIYGYEIDSHEIDDVVEDMRQFFSYELVTKRQSLSRYLADGDYEIKFFPTEDCEDEVVSYLNSKFSESLDGLLTMLAELEFELDTHDVSLIKQCIDSYTLIDA